MIYRDPYSFFLKVVRQASIPDNILALAKFYLPIQKCRIIKKQMAVYWFLISRVKEKYNNIVQAKESSFIYKIFDGF